MLTLRETEASRIAVWVSRILAAMFLFAGLTKLLGAEGDVRWESASP
jgi:hypothetical protein